jgi:hypothetical protein
MIEVILSKTKTQFNFSKPKWNQGPKSIKQVYLFIPTSKKIKKEIKTHKNILNKKKKTTLLPKNLPKTQEKRRFKNGKNNESRYILLLIL